MRGFWHKICCSKIRMRKAFVIALFFFVLLYIPCFTQDKAKNKYFELPNGFKVFFVEKETIPLLNIVIGVNLGSKDETEETSGLLHLLEHYILFRGTELRSGIEISQDTRRHGAYFNAHTGEDLMTFEISLPSEEVEFALKNQKEILFNLKLTQEELNDEKEVVLEELSQVQDDPLKYAMALVYQNLFKNHPYQKPIYGKKETIEALTVEQVNEFYKKYFAPQNCSMAIVGDFSLQDMEGKVRAIFGDLKRGEFTPPRIEISPLLEKNVELEHEMDVKLAYLVMGMIGPDYNNPDLFAIDVLAEILGQGINPMLNSVLRGRRNLVQTISMNYNSHKYGGAILLRFTLDPKNLTSAKNVAIDFLKEARNQNYSKDDFYGEEQIYAFDYLLSAKNQIKFSIHQSQEKGLAVAASLVRYMLLDENVLKGSAIENIERIKSSDLRKAAARYLSKGKYVIVSIVPKKKE